MFLAYNLYSHSGISTLKGVIEGSPKSSLWLHFILTHLKDRIHLH
jgi:hypothetical protein